MSSSLFSSYDMVGVLRELGVLRYIDQAFAAFILREEDSGAKQILAVLAGLVSYTTTKLNNVCLDLAEPLSVISSINLATAEDTARLRGVCRDIEYLLLDVDLAQLCAAARTVAVEPVSGSAPFPLVYSLGKLYLERYWLAESVIAQAIGARVRTKSSMGESFKFPGSLATVYSRFRDQETTWGQQVAVFAAMRANFSVITGGPGTGKTTVVAVLLALYLQNMPEAKIALVAPTGKAQARLKEAVFEEFAFLNVDLDIKAKISNIEFKTLHSLLGLRRGRSKSSAELHYDFIVVDEASMVSVLLFQEFFAAVSSSTKVVLLGDRDQLAAVDGGAVLSDICTAAGELGSFSSQFVSEFVAALPEMSATPETARMPCILQDAVVSLEHTFRFSPSSGIGRMKDILTEGDVSEVGDFLATANMQYADSFMFHQFRSHIPASIQQELLAFIDTWSLSASDKLPVRFSEYLAAANIAEAFSIFADFQIITALNNGPLGVDAINSLLLAKFGMNPDGARGLPIMIEKNDYQTGLFNGDIGMYWEDSQGKMKIWFPEAANESMSEITGFKSYLPSQVPQNSPAFAMTIHKSQGSGFGAVLLLLQSARAEILTKELLYTAVTRAKDKIDIFGDINSVVTIASKSVCRVSSLAQRLV